jgi:hypothetical protein
VTSGSGGKSLGLLWEPNASPSGTPSLRVGQNNSYTSSNAIVYSNNSLFGAVYWFRMRDDGTTASFAFSSSGDDDEWYTFYSVTKAGSFLGAGNYNTITFGTSAFSGDVFAKILSWTVTSP